MRVVALKKPTMWGTMLRIGRRKNAEAGEEAVTKSGQEGVEERGYENGPRSERAVRRTFTASSH